jgi:hypothetical protein
MGFRGCTEELVVQPSGGYLPPPMEPTAAVEPDCEIQQSVLYCQKHEIIAPAATPEHTKRQFHATLLRGWKLQMAKRYPRLQWSRGIRRKDEQRKALVSIAMLPCSLEMYQVCAVI